MSTEKQLEIRKLKADCSVAKSRLIDVEGRLRDIGAIREANSLSTIIQKLEIWQNK